MDVPLWRAFYQSLADGRFRITGPALMAIDLRDRSRILDTVLGGLASKVLLLDKPLKLGERVQGTEISEYYLRRIRIRELPGWPPRIAPNAGSTPYPTAAECRLLSARFRHDGVELTLGFGGEVFKAWHVGCPLPLLKFEEATLNQDGSRGKKLVDLQEMRLIGSV